MIKKRLMNATAAFALLLSGPAFAQTAAPAPTPAPVATVDADPALWVVKDKDTTIYLFGTIHVLKPGLSWFDEAVKTAFDKSDTLVTEIVLPTDQAEAQKIVLPLAVDSTGATLTSKIPADQLPIYTGALAKLGVPANALDQLQPWFAAVTMSQVLLQKAGYSPDNGVEKALDTAAKAAHKPVAGLETLTQQLHYFADLSQEEQVKFLISGAKDIDKFGSTLDEMVGDWAKGDPESLAKVMNEDYDASPVITKTLLTDRNARWADWIEERLKQPGTVFIAVGAGHLAGKNSVQEQLAAKYHVKAVRIAY
jgi:uncharacterized protein YbaP (TraB family)